MNIVNRVDVEKALAEAKRFLPNFDRSELAIAAPGIGNCFWLAH